MFASTFADFFLYAAIIGYVILLIWFGVFIFAKNWMRHLHAKWFDIEPKTFDVLHYSMMGGFKLLIISLFLIPFIALKLS